MMIALRDVFDTHDRTMIDAVFGMFAGRVAQRLPIPSARPRGDEWPASASVDEKLQRIEAQFRQEQQRDAVKENELPVIGAQQSTKRSCSYAGAVLNWLVKQFGAEQCAD